MQQQKRAAAHHPLLQTGKLLSLLVALAVVAPAAALTCKCNPLFSGKIDPELEKAIVITPGSFCQSGACQVTRDMLKDTAVKDGFRVTCAYIKTSFLSGPYCGISNVTQACTTRIQGGAEVTGCTCDTDNCNAQPITKDGTASGGSSGGSSQTGGSSGGAQAVELGKMAFALGLLAAGYLKNN